MATPKKTVTMKKSTEKTSKTSVLAHKLQFDRMNYILMLVGLAIIIIGFALMAGTEDIFDSRKMTIAPIVTLLGFAFEVYAIMRKPAGENNNTVSEQE